MNKIVLAIVDAVAPWVTMAFGIYGLLNDTKPKDGKLTRQAKIALTGIVVSGMISVVLKVGAVMEKINDQDRVAQEQAKTILRQEAEAEKQRQAEANRIGFETDVAGSFNKSIIALDSIKQYNSDALKSLQSVTRKQEQMLTVNEEVLASNSKIYTAQETSLTKLQGLAELESSNLQKSDKLFDELSAVSAPLTPVQFVFRIKYSLKKALFRPLPISRLKENGGWWNPVTREKLGDGDWIHWLGKDFFQSDPDELLDKKKLQDEFYKNYSLKFSFKSEYQSQKFLLSYCENNHCGETSDNVYYQMTDSSLIREIVITSTQVINPNHLKSTRELFNLGFLSAFFFQRGPESYQLRFQYMGDDKKWQKYERELSFTKIQFEPYVEIRYGVGFSLSHKLQDRNVLMNLPQYGNEKKYVAQAGLFMKPEPGG
jgi:hypothetical protein